MGGRDVGAFAGGEAVDQADGEADEAVEEAPELVGLGDEAGVPAEFARDGDAEIGDDDGDKARKFERRAGGGEAKLGGWRGRGRHDRIPMTACEPVQGIFSGVRGDGWTCDMSGTERTGEGFGGMNGGAS